MRDFLKQLTDPAPAAIKRAFEEIIRRKREQGEVRTKDEMIQETERLQRVAENAALCKPTFKRRVIPTGLSKVKSDDINANAEEAVIDVNMLYDYAKSVGKSISGHKRVQESELARIRAGINKLAADVQGYLASLNDDQYTKFIYESFLTGRNAAKASEAAEVDTETGAVKLQIRKKRRLHEYRGSSPTTVEVNPVTPVNESSAFSVYRPENAIDPHKSTFWASLFMTEAAMETEYEGVDYPGVVIELIVNLPFVDRINELRFTPFGQFPMRIIDIRVFGDTNSWTVFNGFGGASAATLRTLEWHGVPQTASRVKFVLQQESYKLVDYMISKHLVQNQNIWAQTVDPETRLVLADDDLYARQLRTSGFNPSYNVYLEGVRRLSKELGSYEVEPYSGEEYNATKRLIDGVAKNMAPGRKDAREVLIKRLTGEEPEPDEVDMIEMRAYEYVLGAYHVEVNNAEYMKEGVYESPKYKCPGTLSDITLNVTETHPATDAGYSPTSIEYELELAEGRVAVVLPENVASIQDEFVFFHPRSRQGKTRFPAAAAPNLQVRGSSRLLSTAEYIFAVDTDGRLVITIDQASFRRNTRYTVSYDYNAGQAPQTVDVEALFDSIPVDEEHKGTDDNGRIRLKRHPFVVMDIINDADFIPREGESGIWDYIGVNPVIFDGVYYAPVNTMLSADLNATANIVNVTNTIGFPAGGGAVLVGNESIIYAAVGVNQLTGCTRGANAHPHPARTPIVGRRAYIPMQVKVDGVEAKNITDYQDAVHPAFTPASLDSIKFEYVHTGNVLYFNQPLEDASIEIRYNTMAEYLKLRATLRANTIQRAYSTPVIDNFMLKIRHSII